MSTTELTAALPGSSSLYSPAERPAFEIPATATTLAGFRRWACSDDFPDRGKITLFQGKLILDMSPERYETHLKLKTDLSAVLSEFVKSRDLGDFYADGALLVNLAADISNEPDAMFASWATLESGKLTPPTDRPLDGMHIELVGTPDWVCEIVSNSSEAKDTNLLRTGYDEAGISEYWLIDARGEEIEFQLLVRGTDGYAAAPANDGWRRSPVFNREFSLTRKHDRLGRWRYDLKHREVSSR